MMILRVCFDFKNKKIYMTSDGGIFLSSDLGSTFNSHINRNLTNLEFLSPSAIRECWRTQSVAAKLCRDSCSSSCPPVVETLPSRWPGLRNIPYGSSSLSALLLATLAAVDFRFSLVLLDVTNLIASHSLA
jgi:hypothetical protein